ncbi:MAG: cytochrome c3 family protein [Myxococcota bacterium]
MTVTDGEGAVKVGCATCHTLREPSPEAVRDAADLEEFHAGLTFDHGELSCRSCHAPPGYDDFRLADGERVALRDSMDLCAQCHGPQKRDYDHGAHGGMTGYWDLDAGPRTRSHCLDCHDAHAPAYRGMVPAFPPRDRFLQGHGPASEHPAPAHDDAHPDRSARR